MQLKICTSIDISLTVRNKLDFNYDIPFCVCVCVCLSVRRCTQPYDPTQTFNLGINNCALFMLENLAQHLVFLDTSQNMRNA